MGHDVVWLAVAVTIVGFSWQISCSRIQQSVASIRPCGHSLESTAESSATPGKRLESADCGGSTALLEPKTQGRAAPSAPLRCQHRARLGLVYRGLGSDQTGAGAELICWGGIERLWPPPPPPPWGFNEVRKRRWLQQNVAMAQENERIGQEAL